MCIILIQTAHTKYRKQCVQPTRVLYSIIPSCSDNLLTKVIAEMRRHSFTTEQAKHKCSGDQIRLKYLSQLFGSEAESDTQSCIQIDHYSVRGLGPKPSH